MIMFVQLQFDQEARRAMILQIGNFKDNDPNKTKMYEKFDRRT